MDVMTLATTLLLIYLTLFLYLKWSFSYWKSRNIPYIEPSIPFGNIDNPITNKKPYAILVQEFYNIFKKQGHGMGGVFTYTLPLLIVIKPAYIKDVLIKNFQNFHSKGFYTGEKHQPYAVGLFTTDGERWRAIRSKFTPAFSSAKMKVMFDVMVDAAKLMEEYIEERMDKTQMINVQECTAQFTLDVIKSCVLGMEFGSSIDTSLHRTCRRIVAGITEVIKFSFCNALPRVADLLKIPVMPRREAEFVCKFIDETVQNRMGRNISRKDFLQFLLEMKQKDIISMDELKGQCFGFLIGGYDTSAGIVSMALFELSKNESLQDKLREEINEALEKYDGKWNYDAIMGLKYLDMVILETLRKYPPVPVLTRKCVEDFTLPDSKIVIEKGTNLAIPVVGLHNDSEYFPDPDQFDPERFSDENKHNILPYTYLPFGDGPRFCIGERFAKQIIKIGLSRVIAKYRFKLNKDTKLPLVLKPAVILSVENDILLDIERV